MLPLIAKLNSAQRAAYSFFTGAVARNLGMNETIRQWSKIGPGIRKTAGLDLYRYIAGTVKSGSDIQATRKDFYPDINRMPESRTNIRREYSYNVRLDMRNTVSGERFSKNMTVSSDRNMRIRDIESEAQSAFYDPESGREDTNVEILQTTIIDNRKRASMYAKGEE